MEADGKEVQRDAFGHVKLDSINPGKYFADTFSALIGAEKASAAAPLGQAAAPPPSTSRGVARRERSGG